MWKSGRHACTHAHTDVNNSWFTKHKTTYIPQSSPRLNFQTVRYQHRSEQSCFTFQTFWSSFQMPIHTKRLHSCGTIHHQYYTVARVERHYTVHVQFSRLGIHVSSGNLLVLITIILYIHGFCVYCLPGLPTFLFYFRCKLVCYAPVFPLLFSPLKICYVPPIFYTISVSASVLLSCVRYSNPSVAFL